MARGSPPIQDCLTRAHDKLGSKGRLDPFPPGGRLAPERVPAVYLTLARRLRDALSIHIAGHFGVDAEVVAELPRKPALGDLATPVCFALAKALRRPPRQIAQELVATMPAVPGIARLEVAGAGFVNARFWRGGFAHDAMKGPEVGASDEGKAIVEHTNINPNKAAHIGHLRNAVLGDTFVRMMRALGRPVEVQNYIDNTGVQVADVVAAFHFLRGHSRQQVVDTVNDPSVRFDYHCWDLYAEVSQTFARGDEEALRWRAATLHALESGEGELAEIGAIVADAIVACHLRTMARIGVQYDVLPRESEILAMQFWSAAFALLKKRKAVHLETAGKNSGCWVMPGHLFRDHGGTPEGDDGSKVIVRSNGTVTYVGKDIAYQLWKFGLLPGKDFHYTRMETTGLDPVWRSSRENTGDEAPEFGRGEAVYNVIDVRQAYLQDVVRAALLALGCEREAKQSVHFSYEMVALSPRCCAELGIELSREERARPYVEVSGRKGLGVKADDLLDLLVNAAFDEVRDRHEELSDEECRLIATEIAVGALRYFMLRYTRNTLIAFDFQEALAFEGETGPYVQYAAVRAHNILRKHAEAGGEDIDVPAISDLESTLADEQLWQLVLVMSRTRWTLARAVASGEPAQLAHGAFQAAQAFSNFYHRTHVLNEPDPQRKRVQLSLVKLSLQQLTAMMETMGMPIPKRM